MDKPNDYARIIEEQHIKEMGIQVIKAPRISYGSYEKNNPNSTDDRINSFGFRGKEFEINKKQGVYRIIILGGSSTFGTGVADGFTYSDYLERMTGFEVINGGIPGHAIDQIEGLLRSEIVALKPDLLIINSVFNNLYQNCPNLFYSQSGLANINKFLLAKSVFYLTLREKLTVLLGGQCRDVYTPGLHKLPDQFMQDNKFWRKLEQHYKSIVGVAHANNIRILLINEPVYLKKGQALLLNEAMFPVYEKYYALLSSLSVDRIDAAANFRQRQDKDQLFLPDGVHLTPKGNEALASLIAKEIKSQKIE